MNDGGGTNPPNSRSINSASFSGVRSSSHGPTIWTPTGRPSGAKPVGIAVEGFGLQVGAVTRPGAEQQGGHPDRECDDSEGCGAANAGRPHTGPAYREVASASMRCATPAWSVHRPRAGTSATPAPAALVPGVSRNGATLTAARARGFSRRSADVLSWAVAMPVIAGASGLRAWRGAREGVAPDMRVAAAAGFVIRSGHGRRAAPGAAPWSGA